ADVLELGLEDAAHSLDGVHAVPAGEAAKLPEEHVAGLRAVQLAALCLWGLTVAVIAAGAGRPGLAFVLGALSLPAILVASSLPWAGLPALAPICGALSAAPIYPAIAGARGRPLERAVLGALGWFWMLAGAAALGLGSRLGMVHSASHGWTRSTGAAAHAILVPLLAPHVLLGGLVFAVGALTLGIVLRATHIAIALLGPLLWS